MKIIANRSIILTFSLLIVCVGFIFGQSANKEKLELVIKNGHPGGIIAIAFSPNGKLLATASGNDNSASTTVNEWTIINIWDIETGGLLRTMPEKADSGTFTGFKLVFSPDGQTLASGIYDTGTIILWNVKNGTKRVIERQPPNSEEFFRLDTLAFNQDGTELISILSGENENKTIKNWNVKTGKILPGNKIITNDQTVVATTDDGKFFVTVSKDGVVKIWDTIQSKVLQTLEDTYSHDDYANENYKRIILSPNGKILAIELLDENDEEGKQVILLSVETGGLLKIFSDAYLKGAFTDNKKILLGYDESYKLYDIENPNIFKTIPLPEVRCSTNNFVFSSKILAYGDECGKVNLWNVENATGLFEFSSQRSITSIAASPTGDFLALGGSSRNIIVWDLKGASLKSLSGHSYDVIAISFSSDGNILASASDDATIRLWDVKTEKELYVFNIDEYSQWLSEVKSDPNRIPDALKNIKSFPDNPRNIDEDSRVKTNTDQMIFEIINNNEVRIIDKKTNKELFSLIALNENDWLAKTPEGLFDGTPNAWKQLIWRFDNDTFNYAPVEHGSCKVGRNLKRPTLI